MLRSGMILGDRYEILSQIGSGGMADVYKAKCHKLNRFVAIKVLKEQYSSDKNFLQRFRAEAQAAAKLSHPNIVSIYDVMDEGNLHYIVMELIEGITLKDYIRRKGKLANRESIGIAVQVAQGLSAAHAQNIVHRDIKPQNIIISREGKVKVMDFGIARITTGETVAANTMGSVHYISPEQARGSYCDHRSDIYSLGITLYEMLTGKVPFDGENAVAVALAHVQNPLVPPKQIVPTITRSMNDIICKCTAKKPSDRYATVLELVSDLRKSLVMPEEAFVVLAPAAVNGETVVFSQEETDALRAKMTGGAANGAASLNGQDSSESGLSDEDADDETDEALEDEYDDEYDEEYDDEDEDSYDEDDEEFDDYSKEPRFAGASGGSKSSDDETLTEKVLKAINILLAVVIVLCSLYVGARVFGIIRNDQQRESESRTVETLDENHVYMPDLIYKTKEEAAQIMKNLGLVPNFLEEYSDIIDEGQIMYQDILPDEIVEKGTEIDLTVSLGGTMVELPADLVGMTVSSAKIALEALDLEVEIFEQFDEVIAKDTVMSYMPFSKTVPKESTITLYVSKGKNSSAPVGMVSVVGRTKEEAIAILDSAQMNNYSFADMASNSFAVGQVCHQSIEAGTMITRDTAVTIYVCSGPESYSMPDLITQQMSRDQAAAYLDQFNLNYSFEEEYSESVPEGMVSSQSVPAGQPVDSSTAIYVYVSKGPKPTEAPSIEITDPVDPPETDPTDAESAPAEAGQS